MRPASHACAGPGPSTVRAAAVRQEDLPTRRPCPPLLARRRTPPLPVAAAARPGGSGTSSSNSVASGTGAAGGLDPPRPSPSSRLAGPAPQPIGATSSLQAETAVSSRTTTPPLTRWRVRPIRPDEVAEAAAIQAAAFYEAAPLSLLDGLLFYAFRGEVLAGLQAKMKYSAADGFSCLVAEALPPDRDWAGSDDPASPSSPPPSPPPFKGLAGVVEVSLQAEADGMAALAALGAGGDDTYAYLACMAVDPAARRAGVATALLAAAERAAGRWRQNWCLLHVHDANAAAVALYEAAGYSALARDEGGGVGPLALLARPKPRTLMGRAARLGREEGVSAGVVPSITSISPNVLALMRADAGRAPTDAEEGEGEGSVM